MHLPCLLPLAKPIVPLIGHLSVKPLPKIPAANSAPLIGKEPISKISASSKALTDVGSPSSAELLPPFELSPSLHSAVFPMSTDHVHLKKNRSPSIEFVSPSHVRPIKKQKSEPIILIWDSDDEMALIKPEDNLLNSSALDTPIIKPTVLSTPPKINAEIIDLITPSPVKIENPCILKKAHSHRAATAQHSNPTSSAASAPQRTIKAVDASVQLYDVYDDLETGVDTVFRQQLALGFFWRRGQSHGDAHGLKKLTVRCDRYQEPKPVHKNNIHPNDLRVGKSKRTGCFAHVNFNRVTDSSKYHITLIDFNHNHDRSIPIGGKARLPATLHQRKVIAELATSTNLKFGRSQIATVLDTQSEGDGHILEPRQISNIMNEARSQARASILQLGGDFAAIIKSLETSAAEDRGWNWRIKLDDTGTVIAIWWQSPVQSALTRRFPDILVNDNTYNRNSAGYALNIGVLIDNFCKSRNAWYALQAREDASLHGWVFRCHLESAGIPPGLLVSDRHRSVISSAAKELPLTDHLYCIFHLDDNITTNLRSKIGVEWQNFQRDFWATYRAVSPEEFDRLWRRLLLQYPAGKDYLEKELYDCREKWAWAWVSSKFTAGIRTNGRIEVENRVNKQFGGPKSTCFQLFQALNERTKGQEVDNMIRVRDVSSFLSKAACILSNRISPCSSRHVASMRIKLKLYFRAHFGCLRTMSALSHSRDASKRWKTVCSITRN